MKRERDVLLLLRDVLLLPLRHVLTELLTHRIPKKRGRRVLRGRQHSWFKLLGKAPENEECKDRETEITLHLLLRARLETRMICETLRHDRCEPFYKLHLLLHSRLILDASRVKNLFLLLELELEYHLLLLFPMLFLNLLHKLQCVT